MTLLVVIIVKSFKLDSDFFLNFTYSQGCIFLYASVFSFSNKDKSENLCGRVTVNKYYENLATLNCNDSKVYIILQSV